LSGLLVTLSLVLEPVLAHVFLPNKNASLLAISNQLKTEIKLVHNSLEQSDNNLPLKYLADATEIQTRKNNISSFSIPYFYELRQLIELMPADSDQPESFLHIIKGLTTHQDS
jgi:hypothetical protein